MAQIPLEEQTAGGSYLRSMSHEAGDGIISAPFLYGTTELLGDFDGEQFLLYGAVLAVGKIVVEVVAQYRHERFSIPDSVLRVVVFPTVAVASAAGLDNLIQ